MLTKDREKNNRTKKKQTPDFFLIMSSLFNRLVHTARNLLVNSSRCLAIA